VTHRARHLIAVLCGAVALLLLAAAPSMAGGPVLQKAKARSVAMKTAHKVRNDLESEGAQDAGVAGCWRNSVRRVSCYLKVKGYDPELDFRWTCMLRMVVELRITHSGAPQLKSRYGQAVCG
jgi:hypothetical protein